MTENNRRFQIQNVFPAAALEKELAHWAKSGALSLGERAQTRAHDILRTFVLFASHFEKTTVVGYGSVPKKDGMAGQEHCAMACHGMYRLK